MSETELSLAQRSLAQSDHHNRGFPMPTPTPTSMQPQAQAVFQPILEQHYEQAETRELVKLVDDATELVRTKGEAAFGELAIPGSRWRHDETYVFVLDPEGTMHVHPDASMEGKNQLDLTDSCGKPVIRGLIAAATMAPANPGGWYHYQWPVPGGLLPRWKSSYVRSVQAPSGTRYIVGCGIYNERMERAFVIDAVEKAVALIENRGEAAFAAFRDPTGPFLVKDAYVSVLDLAGVQLVNPQFPFLEGRNLLDMTDTQGRHLVRELIETACTHGSGWVDYLWPKPGDSISTLKSTYVSTATLDDKPVVVGCGVYLADAPIDARPVQTMTASELRALVGDAAELLEQQGERAYAELGRRGSRWVRDSAQFFAVALDGSRWIEPAEPAREAQPVPESDVLGRPIRQMLVDVGTSAAGEGWVHGLWPEPGKLFPTWQSTFVKRVTLPSGAQQWLACGIHHMKMDQAVIEEVVDRAATLIAERGEHAFSILRDKTGPFVFMDTYVFVLAPDGVQLVNPVFPSLEGRNLLDVRDLTGKAVIQDEISLALGQGSGWLQVYWFKPGDNTTACKQTFVRKVQSGKDTFIIGSGLYVS